MIRRVIARWTPTLCVCVAALYIAGHALSGDDGVTAWAAAKTETALLEATLEELTSVRATLESRAFRLRETSLDLDYLDERARALAGMAHPLDVLVPASSLPSTVRVNAPG